MLLPIALAMVAPTPASYDVSRSLTIFKELAVRSVGVLPTAGARERQKAAILDALSPFGNPALNVPAATFEKVDAACKRLERLNPVAGRDGAAIKALQGAWRVRYS